MSPCDTACPRVATGYGIMRGITNERPADASAGAHRAGRRQGRDVMVARVLVLWLVMLVAPLSPARAAQDPVPTGVAPVGIRIPQALVDTVVEPLSIPGGLPELPSSPWIVGWYEETAGLGVPGNAVLVGYSDWWDVGPAVFRFISQLPSGSSLELTGADGAIYRYELEWANSYPRDTAPIDLIFGQGFGNDEMVTIYLGADPYDPVTSEYLNILILRARRTADAPTPAPAQAPATLYDPAGCPVDPSSLPLPGSSQPWPYPVAPPDDTLPSRYLEHLGIAQAKQPAPETIAAIDATISGATQCDIAVRTALQLPDGNVLALVGPTGAIPLAEIAGTVQPELRGVIDATLANVFAFLLFTAEGGEWRLVPGPPSA